MKTKRLSIAVSLFLLCVLLTACAVTEVSHNSPASQFVVGNHVTFGNYPQTSDGNDSTPIEWLVLAREGNKALLISRYALDCQQYHTNETDITWENCSLRNWLNVVFLNKAFSAAEQSAILTTGVEAHKNPVFSTNSGYSTLDKVFLPSITEAEKYFTSDSAMECSPTAYAVKQGISSSMSQTGKMSCSWWLRSPGVEQDTAAFFLHKGGYICTPGCSVRSNVIAVRPALWVNLDSGIF